MFQGHNVIKVKVHHDPKMTLQIKFAEYGRVVPRLKALNSQIPDVKEFLCETRDIVRSSANFKNFLI